MPRLTCIAQVTMPVWTTILAPYFPVGKDFVKFVAVRVAFPELQGSDKLSSTGEDREPYGRLKRDVVAAFGFLPDCFLAGYSWRSQLAELRSRNQLVPHPHRSVRHVGQRRSTRIGAATRQISRMLFGEPTVSQATQSETQSLRRELCREQMYHI